MHRSAEPHLLVDSGDDGGSDAHPDEEAAVEILVQDERLDERVDEHAGRQHVALELRRVLVLRELYQSSENVRQWFLTPDC